MWRILASLVALVLFAATPVRAEWRRAESPNFVLYGNVSEAALRARILLLEDFDRLLRTLTSADEPANLSRLHIYIVDGPADLRVIRPLPPGIAGFYSATPDGIAAFVDGRVAAAGNHILLHEYAHHFMRQHSRNAYPAWYSEGFAEYFATVRFTARRIDIGNFEQSRAYAVVQGEWLPMERILSGGPEGLNREQMGLFYAQSWLLVHYFHSTPERQAALARLLGASRRADAARALLAATGLTPQGLTAELRRYIRGGTIQYRQMVRGSAETPPPVAVTVMPRSAADMILYAGILRIGIPEESRQPYLELIRAAAARHPDDPLAMRVLAHAEALHGDGAAADRLLDRLLAAAPNDVELLYLKGMRYLILAESDNPPEEAAATARIWFERASQADGNHFQSLFRLAESRRGGGDFISEATTDLLLRAHRLAPQVPSITMNAASLLIARREYVQAISLLMPLALSPHDSGLAEAARRLMARAQAESQRPRQVPRDEEAPAEAGED